MIRLACISSFVLSAVLAWTQLSGQEASPPPIKAGKQRVDLYGDPLPPGAMARIGTTRFWNGWSADPLAFSSTGREIVALGADGIVRIWDIQSAKELRRINAENGRFSHIAVTPDGKTLVTGGYTDDLRIWDIASGKETGKIPGSKGSAQFLAFSHDGQFFAASIWNKGVQIWKTSNWTEVHKIEAKGKDPDLRTLVFLHDGRTALVLQATRLGALKLVWLDFTTKMEIRHKEMKDRDEQLVVSPDGTKLAFIRDKSELVIWNASTGAEIGKRVLEKMAVYDSFSLAFSPDSQTLARAYSTGNKIQFFTPDNKVQERLRWEGNKGARSMTYSADGKTLAVAADRMIELRDVATGKHVVEVQRWSQPVSSLLFDANDRSLMVACQDGFVANYDPFSGKRLAHLLGPSAGEGAQTPASIVKAEIATDGRKAVLFDRDGTIRIWDLSQGKQLKIISDLFESPRFDSRGADASLSPDGSRLVLANTNKRIQIWDAASAKVIGILPEPPILEKEEPPASSRAGMAHASYSNTPRAFSGDGRFAAFAAKSMGTRSVQVADLATGKEAKRLTWDDESYLEGLAFLDKEKIVTFHIPWSDSRKPKSIRIWDWQAAKVIRSFSIEMEHVTCAVLSPDGRTIATGNENAPRNTILLWDMATGGLRARITGHLDPIRLLAFSNNGRMLASASDDSTVVFWDLTGNAPGGTLVQHDAAAKELDMLWNDLASEDGAKAYKAMWSFVAAKQTVAFLGEHLKPAPSIDEKRPAKLIAELDSEIFATRDKATSELEKMGEQIEPMMRKALTGKPSLEARQRLQTLVDKVTSPLLSRDELRDLRAVEALEHIGDAAARQLLSALATGGAGARLTRESQASLGRLTIEKK